ncbi:hypothetical protein H9P43_008907 [Blastocladiella emersonii ATCC 22665]|nr:hypothetical protein H9P43_008907 [Blastocladiella emersonii ATCC 22665]
MRHSPVQQRKPAFELNADYNLSIPAILWDTDPSSLLVFDPAPKHFPGDRIKPAADIRFSNMEHLLSTKDRADAMDASLVPFFRDGTKEFNTPLLTARSEMDAAGNAVATSIFLDCLWRQIEEFLSSEAGDGPVPVAHVRAGWVKVSYYDPTKPTIIPLSSVADDTVGRNCVAPFQRGPAKLIIMDDLSHIKWPECKSKADLEPVISHFDAAASRCLVQAHRCYGTADWHLATEVVLSTQAEGARARHFRVTIVPEPQDHQLLQLEAVPKKRELAARILEQCVAASFVHVIEATDAVAAACLLAHGEAMDAALTKACIGQDQHIQGQG